MSLLAYNLTTAPLALAAGSPPPVLPASASAGSRSAAKSVGSELKALSPAQFASIQAQVAAKQCVFEWSGLPEFNTYSLVVGSAQEDQTDLDINIFVDPVAGDDFNPGTAALPLKTFPAAWAKMVPGKKQRRMFLAAGTYDVDTDVYTQFNIAAPLDDGEPVTILGTPLPVAGLAGLQLTVASSASGNRKITAQASHVGSLVGAAVLFTSGAANGRRFLIGKDDGTTFVMVNRSNAPIVNGDTFVVERPGSIINDIGNTGFQFFGGPVLMKDVKFFEPNFMVYGRGCFAASNENVEIELGAFAAIGVLEGAQVFPQSFPVLSLSPNPFLNLRDTCGMYVHTAAPTGNESLVVTRGGIFGRVGGGGMVLENLVVNPFNGGKVQGCVVFMAINCQFMIEQSQLELSGRISARSCVDGSIAGTAAIGLFTGSSLDMNTVDVNNADGNAFDISAGATAFMDAVGGAGNVGVGIAAHDIGNATLGNDGGGNSTVATSGTNGVVLSTAVTDNPLTAAALAVNVVSTAGFPAAGTVKIDNELISYIGLTPTSFLGCTRGAFVTIPALHLVGALAFQASGFDTKVGAVPKTYGALPYGEINGSGPTLNRIGILGV